MAGGIDSNHHQLPKMRFILLGTNLVRGPYGGVLILATLRTYSRHSGSCSTALKACCHVM